MCTLTYIPIGSNDFFFTSNRDESPQREAKFPEKYCIGDSIAIYPKDKLAEGTWIMCHENNFSLCLLNGAFQKHIHKPPYIKSRGVMVLEFSKFSSSIDFIMRYNFDGMEPFTLLVLSYLKNRELEEIRWDGESIHYRKLNSFKLYIWSSSTLYDQEARKMRSNWFADWCTKQSDISKKGVLDFHRNAGAKDSFNALMMNRKEKVKTLSITQIVRKNKRVSMYYNDLAKDHSSDTYF